MFKNEKKFFEDKVLPLIPVWIIAVFIIGMIGAFLPAHSWAEKPIKVIFFIICIIPMDGVVIALIFSVFDEITK